MENNSFHFYGGEVLSGMAGDQQAALFVTWYGVKNTYGTGSLIEPQVKRCSYLKITLTTIGYKINGKVYYALKDLSLSW